METIHVNIGKDPEKSNELIRFLYTLLSNTYKAEEKEKILTSEYEMEFNEDDRRRIRRHLLFANRSWSNKRNFDIVNPAYQF
jgi:hypothetical protein